MIKSGDIVLIDTNVIIESYRLSCWPHLSKEFKLHTVSKVLEETQTGFGNRVSPIIDYLNLKNSFDHIRDIGPLDLLNCAQNFPDANIMGLDPGERDLLAYATTLGESCWLLCSPDKAAMRTAHSLEFLDLVVSLEVMLDVTSLKIGSKLKENYTEAWNSRNKLSIKMGLL